MRPCFNFTAAAGTKPAVLALDEEIGFWGMQAKDFRAQLNAVPGNDLIVEINSVGGDVFAGLGIYNMLRYWASEGKTVTTRIGALAASIGSVIFLAGDKRQMPSNAFVMTHAPMTIAGGTEEDLRDAADVLAKIKASMRGIYMQRLGVDEATADSIMAKDTWLTADEAKAIGFVETITDAVEATAKFDVSRLDLPAGATLFKAKAPELKPEDKPLAEQIIALAKTAGVEAHAADITLQANSLDEAQARVKAVAEINTLCTMAGKPEMVARLVRSNKPVAEVKAALLKARAENDPDIDNTDPNATKPKPGGEGGSFSPTNTWAKHNSQQAKHSKGR